MVKKNEKNISEAILKKLSLLSEQTKELDIKIGQKNKETIEEFKRYTGALGEEFQDRVQGVAEQVAGNTEKLFTIEEKLDSIANELCRKVGYEEFQSLTNRVSKLEQKIK